MSVGGEVEREVNGGECMGEGEVGGGMEREGDGVSVWEVE